MNAETHHVFRWFTGNEDYDLPKMVQEAIVNAESGMEAEPQDQLPNGSDITEVVSNSLAEVIEDSIDNLAYNLLDGISADEASYGEDCLGMENYLFAPMVYGALRRVDFCTVADAILVHVGKCSLDENNRARGIIFQRGALMPATLR